MWRSRLPQGSCDTRSWKSESNTSRLIRPIRQDAQNCCPLLHQFSPRRFICCFSTISLHHDVVLMPRNLELKATCSSLSAARNVARRIGAKYAGKMRQTDTYYRVRSGRLKLREIDGKRSELICYERPSRRRSRYSNYVVIPLEKARPVQDVLRAVLGESIVVRKERTLFLYKNSRIHLDRVRGLGSFIEFEVLVKNRNKQAEGLMRFLRKEFGIRKNSLIAGSYSDLRLERR